MRDEQIQSQEDRMVNGDVCEEVSDPSQTSKMKVLQTRINTGQRVTWCRNNVIQYHKKKLATENSRN